MGGKVIAFTNKQVKIVNLMRRDEYATVSYGKQKNYCPVSATDPDDRSYCRKMCIDGMIGKGLLIEIKPGVFRRNMESPYFKDPNKYMPLQTRSKPKRNADKI